MKKLLLYIVIILGLVGQVYCEILQIEAPKKGISFFTKYNKFSFNIIDTQTVDGYISTKTGKTITIEWGDGTSTTYSGYQAFSKDYGSVGNRIVTINNANAFTYFYVPTVGANISFDIAKLPRNVTVLYILGSNTIYGDISKAPSALTYLYVAGNNTLSGDIGENLSSIATFRIQGANTIGGDVNDISVLTTYFYITGNNIITGDIANLKSALATFYCRGNNTLYGDMGLIPSIMTSFAADGFNTIDSYTSKSWPADMSFINLEGIGGLSSAEVDQLLIDLSTTTWAGTLKDIDLTGTGNAPRTSASDAAVATLQGMGVTITTNP